MTDSTLILIDWVLGLLSLLAVLVAVGYAAWCAWSLMKAALRVQRQLTPIVDGLGERAGAAGARAESAADHGVTIGDNIARLERSFGRLTVLLRAFRETSARWQRLRSFVQ